jgi:hypothetical protein
MSEPETPPTVRKRNTMSKKKVAPTRWHDGTTPVENLAPDEQLAHQLVSEFGDLSPSVQRIMDAEIDQSQRVLALSAFRDSLGKIGDPNRDPRVAIAMAAQH